jgi:DNA-directed RNA polymerase subunit H (RpoH/RPB5)
MNENSVYIETIYRSRMTLLDLLEARGYDVEVYHKFSPAEAAAAAGSVDQFAGLSFKVTKDNDEENENENENDGKYDDSDSNSNTEEEYDGGNTVEDEKGKKVCQIRYSAPLSRQKIGSCCDNILNHQCKRVEVIYVINGPITELYHSTAAKLYMAKKPNGKPRHMRVFFFQLEMLVMNPLKHVLVPPHEIIPADEHKQLLEDLYLTTKSKLPHIKFHIDPITRCIGAVPGDIIKITRSSASAGIAVIYRVCTV